MRKYKLSPVTGGIVAVLMMVGCGGEEGPCGSCDDGTDCTNCDSASTRR